MKCGISVPNFGQFGWPSVLIGLSQRAEAAGWDGFFLWDHIVWRRPVPLVDCWVMLGAIAGLTRRITVGPLVAAVPRRRPWNVARAITTLDHLAEGRTVLGVGLGALREEFESFGEEWDQVVRAANSTKVLRSSRNRGSDQSITTASISVSRRRLNPAGYPRDAPS